AAGKSLDWMRRVRRADLEALDTLTSLFVDGGPVDPPAPTTQRGLIKLPQRQILRHAHGADTSVTQRFLRQAVYFLPQHFLTSAMVGAAVNENRPALRLPLP